MHKSSQHVVRASELSQFAYCPHAWYLESVLRLPSANVAYLEEGAEVHRRHGRKVYLALRLQRLGAALVTLGVLALAVWAIARVWGG